MTKFKYKVSVVIPVYNTSNYLEQCINSVINQTMKFNDVQAILVNDGSIDNSEDICKKYSEEYENILYLKQKNSGVSAARNNGIKNSKGKYIVILDSDDYLSSNTLDSLYNFFENHYDEVDLVTYPIYTFNIKVSKNVMPRYKLLDKGTGVYDLNEYFYFQQKTINIMFKNMLEDNIYYDEKMFLSEDQDFNTKLLMNKEKIGYVDTCKYFYRKVGTSVSSTKNNPFYCFEDIISYNEKILRDYSKNGVIPKYIQNLVATTLCWRISSDELFPYFYDKEKYNNAKERIYNIINKIDVDVINKLDVNYYTKFYFLLVNNKTIEYKVKQNEILFTCNDKIIVDFEPINSIVFEYKIINNYLYFGAIIKSFILNLKNVSVFLVQKNKDEDIVKRKITLEKSNGLGIICDDVVNNINIYNIREKINIEHGEEFWFEIKIDNNYLPIKFKFNRFLYRFTNNKKYLIKYLEKNNSYKFYIKKYSSIKLSWDSFKQDFKWLISNRSAFVYRILAKIYSLKYKNIYLYSDRNDLIDNAFYQFKHDFKEKDKYKKYYVSDINSNDIFTSEELKYIVKPYSFKHKMLFLNSSRIYTSFSDLQIYCPFNKGIVNYKDIKKYDLYYLQHGVLHANLRGMYSREFTEISKFIISSNFEKENLTENYHYREENLICSTMPRMSYNNLSSNNKQNKILYAPSWRKYLIGYSVKGKRAVNFDLFTKSNFYNDINNFLKSKELYNILEKNDLYLDLKFHPIMKEYNKKFYTNDRIRLVDNINLDEYQVFITDFSSFQFDYIKLKRPIVYYLPDHNEFYAGLHSYRKLELNYDKAFGELCKNDKELIKELKSLIDNKFKPNKKYIERMNNFFYKVENPCEIISKK